MKRWLKSSCLWASAQRASIFFAWAGLGLSAVAQGAAMNGETVYKERCALCHDNAADRTPPRAQLQRLAPEDIVNVLTKGAMQLQATGLGEEEVRNVATYLSGKELAQAASVATSNQCAKEAGPINLSEPNWIGWGNDLENTRFQPNPKLTAEQVSRLKPKWAYAYDGRSAIGQPTVAAGRVYVTHASGRVSAIDAKTGCEYWKLETNSSVRTPVMVAPLSPDGRTQSAEYGAFFGTFNAMMYGVDARTGRTLWQVKVDEHPVARLTGAPTYYKGVLYVPVSSHEEPAAANEKYGCCTFRGAVVAMEAATGKILWKGYGIPSEPKPTKINSAGVQMFGPAGGAIWSAPTIDTKRGLVYAATGNSYTDADTDGGNDSIVAFDLRTGKRVWASQATPKDSFLLGCGRGKEGKGNCPEEIGPDHDFGSSPLLRTLPNGKQIIVAGQKSGMVYGLDPDKQGKVVWQTRVGKGSALGGVEWGFSADQQNAYVPVSDVGAAAAAGASDGAPMGPGLYALNLATGKVVWNVPTPTITCSWTNGRCTRAQAAASSTIPGVVFSGAFDGHLRAYSTKDGAILWDYDTAPTMDTVNAGKVEGGSIDATGPVIVDGVVYIASGYGSWGKNGRLLIAFTVDGK